VSIYETIIFYEGLSLNMINRNCKNYLYLFVMLALVSTSLFGCTEKTKSAESMGVVNAPKDILGNTTAITKEEPVKLKFWMYADDSNVSQKEIITNFQKENPTIQVEPEFIPYNGGPEKIQVAVAGNNAPDLLLDQTARLMTFASQGKLAPLDDVLAVEDKKDISEAVLGEGKFRGKMYVFPTGASNSGFMINRTLFKEAGAEDLLPKGEDKTWDFEQFRKALKAVTKNGVYGTAFYAASEQSDAFTFALLSGYGAELFNEDYSKATINSSEGVKALSYMLSLMDEKVVVPGAATMNDDMVLEMFNQKKIAVTIGGPANVTAIKNGLEDGSIKGSFDVDLVMIPGDIPKSVSRVGGYAAFDNKDTMKLEAVKKFITFATRPESMKIAGKFSTTTRKSVADEIYKDDPITQYATNTLSKYAGRLGNQVVGYPEIRAAFFPELQAAYSKVKTPQQALDDFVKKTNDIIAKYQK
jgi:multiple sugar transport system substrate-binding protein